MGDGPSLGGVLFGGTSKGGITGCSGGKKEVAQEVRYNPFPTSVNCDPDTLAGKTYDEIADHVIIYLNLVKEYSLSVERQTAVKEAIVNILKKHNGNNALPFKEEVASEPTYYKMYMMSECRGLAWHAGKAPDIILPTEEIKAAAAKIAATKPQVMQAPKVIVEKRPPEEEVKRPLITALTQLETGPEMTMVDLNLSTIPLNFMITKNPKAPVTEQLTIIGGEFSDSSQVEVTIDDKKGNVKVISSVVLAGNNLLVTIEVKPEAINGTYVLAITETIPDKTTPNKSTVRYGDVPFEVIEPKPVEQSKVTPQGTVDTGKKPVKVKVPTFCEKNPDSPACKF